MNCPETKDAARFCCCLEDDGATFVSHSYVDFLLSKFSYGVRAKNKRIKSNVLQFIWMSFIRSVPSTLLYSCLEMVRRTRTRTRNIIQQTNNHPPPLKPFSLWCILIKQIKSREMKGNVFSSSSSHFPCDENPSGKWMASAAALPCCGSVASTKIKCFLIYFKVFPVP